MKKQEYIRKRRIKKHIKSIVDFFERNKIPFMIDEILEEDIISMININNEPIDYNDPSISIFTENLDKLGLKLIECGSDFILFALVADPSKMLYDLLEKRFISLKRINNYDIQWTILIHNNGEVIISINDSFYEHELNVKNICSEYDLSFIDYKTIDNDSSFFRLSPDRWKVMKFELVTPLLLDK